MDFICAAAEEPKETKRKEERKKKIRRKRVWRRKNTKECECQRLRG